jgi:hypothetical protein
MTPDTDLPTAPTDGFVFWDPCNGLQPIAMQDPRAFLMGRAVVAAISLGVLGLLGFLLPPG